MPKEDISIYRHDLIAKEIEYQITRKLQEKKYMENLVNVYGY